MYWLLLRAACSHLLGKVMHFEMRIKILFGRLMGLVGPANGAGCIYLKTKKPDQSDRASITFVFQVVFLHRLLEQHSFVFDTLCQMI
jgi:hypothetical protein